MPTPYDYAVSGGYPRTRADWVDFPSTSTPITQAQLDQFDQATYDLKRVVVNVKDYGAKGDGSTSDTTAIQNAINAVPSYAGGFGGGIVYFPPGQYSNINSSLTIPSDGITFLGSGQRSTMIEGTVVGPIIKNTGVRGYIAMKNLFVRNASTNASARAIELDNGVNDLVLEDITAQSAGGFGLRLNLSTVIKIRGGRYGGVTGPEASIGISNANVISLLGPSISDSKSGIQLLGCNSVSISGSTHFEAIAGSAPTYQGAITGSANSGVEIIGNYWESCLCPAIQFYSNIGFNYGGMIGGNYIANCSSPMVSAANCKGYIYLPNRFVPGGIAVNANGIGAADSTTTDCVMLPQLIASGTGTSDLSTGATAYSHWYNSKLIGTDEQVRAADGVQTKFLSAAGKTTVVDGDFTQAPANGAMAVHYDTTAGKAYWSIRANGVWKVMAGPI